MNALLNSIVASEAVKPVTTPIVTIATHVRALHEDVEAILAYGSAFRDATPEDTLIDLYVLTRSSHGVSSSALSRFGCLVVPPNVYYAECISGGKTYRAKYAVLPFDQFASRVSTGTENPYFWARFAQPSRIIWTADDSARLATVNVLSIAAATAWANAAGLGARATPAEQWAELFRNTYRTELRPESQSRAKLIVDANLDYFNGISAALKGIQPITAIWPLRRVVGKALSIARLVKASFTFQGGADYIAWKIKRHSGVAIEVTDWQRRHPLLASLVLLPKLLRRGAIK